MVVGPPIACLLVFCGMAISPSADAQSSGPSVQVNVVTTFAQGEHPGGIAAEFPGLIDIGMVAGTDDGQIVLVDPFGHKHTVATLPANVLEVVGLGFYRGQLKSPTTTTTPPPGSVYRVGWNGQSTVIPGTQQIGLADSNATDAQGDLYITDDVPGDSKIWKVAPGGTAQVWSTDPLIQGGANSAAGHRPRGRCLGHRLRHGGKDPDRDRRLGWASVGRGIRPVHRASRRWGLRSGDRRHLPGLPGGKRSRPDHAERDRKKVPTA